MNFTTEPYTASLQHLPQQGQHIVAHQPGNDIIVYQAYNPAIAKYAVANQVFGGSNYSYNRMSWIKPNFLWMMFRSGWAQKENQERVLAIRISQADFDGILGQAAFTSFDAGRQASREAWAATLETHPVRLQWDPDHDPYGAKVTRRAMQLGLKDEVLRKFGQEQVKEITDITEFVYAQYEFVRNHQLDKLIVPLERVYVPADPALIGQYQIDTAN